MKSNRQDIAEMSQTDIAIVGGKLKQLKVEGLSIAGLESMHNFVTYLKRKSIYGTDNGSTQFHVKQRIDGTRIATCVGKPIQ